MPCEQMQGFLTDTYALAVVLRSLNDLGLSQACRDLFIHELDRHGVDTVTLVCVCHLLPLKDMAEVTSAFCTHDLDAAHPKRVIHLYGHGIFETLVKSRPPAGTGQIVRNEKV